MDEQTKKSKQETTASALRGEAGEQELQACQTKRDEYLAGWQRERADALNARRDYEQKLESLKEIVKEELLAAAHAMLRCALYRTSIWV